MPYDTEVEEIENDELDVSKVCDDYQTVLTDFGTVVDAANRAYSTRHCKWPGATWDQRKHARAGPNGTKLLPTPWDKASDLKVPVVDELINDAVALDCTAFMNGNILGIPTGVDDIGKATMAANYIRWRLRSQMRETKDEAELISQIRHEMGVGILFVYWDVQVTKVSEELTVQDLMKMMPDVAQALSTGALDKEVADVLRETLGQKNAYITRKRATQMVKDLKSDGMTYIPVVKETESRPKIEALRPGEDILFPVGTTDIQKASAIYVRKWLTPTESRQMIHTDGWDEDYVEHCAQHCAERSPQDLLDTEQRYQEARTGYGGGSQPGIRAGLIPWVYAYQRRSDENGLPGIYLTVFCPAAHKSDSAKTLAYECAKNILINYRHGKYPFVPFRREVISKTLLDSRGIPETGMGFQNATKVEMDSRIDAASMQTLPPRFHPPGKPPGAWGPGVSLPSRAGRAEYGYFEGPGFTNNSVEVQGAVNTMTRGYYGRVTSELDQAEAQRKQQKQVNDFMAPWRDVFDMIWELGMQFGPDEEWFRVQGVPSASAMKFVKSEFSRKYDFYFSWRMIEPDPEVQLKKLKELGPIIQSFDAEGQVDREKFLYLIMSSFFDPVLTDGLIQPREVAMQKEIKATDEDISKMWAGIDIDPPMKTAPQIRLQRLQQWQQGSPDNPAVDVQARLQTDKAFATRIQKYNDKLVFQHKQFTQNPLIGQQGGLPSYQS